MNYNEIRVGDRLSFIYDGNVSHGCCNYVELMGTSSIVRVIQKENTYGVCCVRCTDEFNGESWYYEPQWLHPLCVFNDNLETDHEDILV